MKLTDALSEEEMNARRNDAPDFITTHKLPFEVADWDPNKSKISKFLNLSFDTSAFLQFKVGTVYGLWSSTSESYIILSIYNEEPGNGHFEDVLQWFYYSCVRDKKHLRIEELMNDDFARHLREERGFAILATTAVKFWDSMKKDLKELGEHPTSNKEH